MDSPPSAPPIPPHQPLAWAVAIGTTLLAGFVGPALSAAFDSPAVPSTSTLALLLGAALGALPGVRARLASGAKRVSKAAIPVAIVLVGFGLDVSAFLRGDSALASVAAVLLCMAAAFAATLAWGRLLGLDRSTTLLLSAGTAVCGNSAVMAVAPAVGPRDEEVALTVGVVNLLSVVLLLGIPPLVGGLGLVDSQGGAVAGLTIHALPQALAAGESVGPAALESATLTKLMRVAMLGPVVLVFTLALRRTVTQATDEEPAERVGLPLFLVLFVAAAVVRSLGLADGSVAVAGTQRAAWEWANSGGKLVLAVALAAIGLGLDVRQLVRVGPRVLAVGLASSATVVAGALLVVTWLL